MQTSDIEQQQGSLFKYLGHSKGILTWLRGKSDADNPFMLDAINEIGEVLTVYGRNLQAVNFKRLQAGAQSHPDETLSYESGFKKAGKRKDKGKMRMVRVSECKYFVATVSESRIFIETSGLVFRSRPSHSKKLDSRIEEVMEFTLSEGEYSYLEWSPLNHASSEKPSFLTLDDKGRLKVHYVKEKAEQDIELEQTVEPGEIFRSAAFALGGKCIYAINEEQELCKIDLQELKIVMKRKIKGLDDPRKVVSSHIKQVTPWTFVIGSVMKTTDDEEANLKPYLHLVSGNISDEFKIKAFEMPLIETFDIKKPVIFRTMYLKGRQLLFFGHSGSNQVRVLNFAFGKEEDRSENRLIFLDGNEREIETITFGDNRTLRGVIFMKENTPKELFFYQNKELESSQGPKLVIMDSEGDIHHYLYFDPKSCAPTRSLFIRPQSIEGLVARTGYFRRWLKKKEKNRCKSRDLKIGITSTAQKKRTSKSDSPIKYLPSETEISLSRKQNRIQSLKESYQKFKSPRKTEDKPVQSGLFSINLKDSKLTTNNLFSSKADKSTTSSLFSENTENKPTTSNLFSAKLEGKSTRSNLFSAASSSTKTTGNSLFGLSSKPNFSAHSGPQNSLFGPATISTKKPSGSETSDIFSLNNQNQTSQTLPDDPVKKKALLFLNKLESDVTFKVEDQEFPAHKSILSEKCRFFKNMFSSGMSESYAQVIEISDTKASMFKGFLQYVYLGKATLNEELAMGLFEFSEKYMIDELKESCENCLAYWITLKNCIKIYETACFYEADSLKGKTLLFFQTHIKEITASKDFEHLPKSTYILLKRIQWNDKMIFDPSFAQLLNGYRKSGSETSGWKNFLK